MKQLKFYGLGGQGVVTAAKALSIAVSIHEGKYAITVPAYGHERRGAPVFSDVVLDDKPVKQNCFVYEPDVVVVMDAWIDDKNVDVAKGKHGDTVLVLNTDKGETVKRYADKHGFKNIYYTDATQIALENIGIGIPNASILGALAKTGVVAIEAIEQALKDFFGEKAGEKNANAARDAFNKTCKA